MALGRDRADLPAALATLTGSAHSLYTVAFDPVGTMLADGGGDGEVRLWQTDATTAEQQLCTAIGQPLDPADWERVAPGLPFTVACG